uniref:ShKT domain-containing protein n=1 Tax=Haemonchus contortus TaxID=6289 RepID=A0A7I5EAZ5_HAECO
MLLSIAFVFVLVNNAFAAETNKIKPCEDKGHPGLCRRMKEKGQCLMGTYVEFGKGVCAKTCEWCTPEEPKKPESDCKNQLDSKSCYEMYERGNCEVGKELCAKTCYYCY